MRRSDTTKKEYCRSGRMFFQDGQWSFHTREGDSGPHDTREAAELRLERYFNKERHQRDTLTREDDPDRDKVWFRSRRIFHTDDGWYVGTREGNRGPFPDPLLADIESKYFVRELKREKVAQPSKPFLFGA